MRNDADDRAKRKSGLFDLNALIGRFPESAQTMLVDVRLTDENAASSRMFRIYRDVPPHFHATCDEYLLVVSGRGRFVVDGLEPVELGPGQLLFFRRNVVHGIPAILEAPLVIFSVDTPRRDPSDVTFVRPEDGTLASFSKTFSY